MLRFSSFHFSIGIEGSCSSCLHGCAPFFLFQHKAEEVLVAEAELGAMLERIMPIYVGTAEGTHVKPKRGVPPKQLKSLPSGITKKQSYEVQKINKNWSWIEDFMDEEKIQKRDKG